MRRAPAANNNSGTAVTTEQQNVINANGQPGFNFNNQPLGNNLSTTALAGASKKNSGEGATPK
jgi:hypothetical protein